MDEHLNKRICYECVGESYLSNEMHKEGIRKKCSYCGSVQEGYSINQLSNRIEKIFKNFYQRTPDDPDEFQSRMLADRESSYLWYREGTVVTLAIEDVAGIPTDAAADIQEILSLKHSNASSREIGEECEFDKDSHYEYTGGTSKFLEENWAKFEASLKRENRFFNTFGQQQLGELFDNIERFSTYTGKSIVSIVGPRRRLKSIFRARSFQSDDSLEIALKDVVKNIGPPPHNLAQAGRMNASGISVFYGADNANAAISEIRPPVGCKVIVAEFRFIRDLRLLDLKSLNHLKSNTSIFDPLHGDDVAQVMFLRQLCERITIPIMPTDEVNGYLVTQAIADFLAMNKKLNLDGIIYPSIQSGKHSNIVLFFKASQVEKRKVPPGTDINVILEEYDETGPYPSFTVFEETVSIEEQRKITELTQRMPTYFSSPKDDFRVPSLRINSDSIQVHLIKAAKYAYETHSVSFHRMKKINPDDLKESLT